MKNFSKLILYFIILCSLLFADKRDKINLNPNPTGTPWYLDNYTPPQNKEYMSDKTINDILDKSMETLPSRIDHTYSKYMRPIFSQSGGSCGSSARICYQFAYELNNFRNLKADNLKTQYPSHFTWLVTGQNSNKEEMAKFNGVPSALYYNGNTVSTKYGGDVGWPSVDEAPDYGWMNGYNRWFNAMHNRLDKTLLLTLETPEKLEVLKQWMNNHHDDLDFQRGGIAGAGCAISGCTINTIPNQFNGGGEQIVTKWGNQVDHATTWSGYDDSVAYDFNGDGKITNDIDLNADGKIDMADWERGALIMLNSWGDGWANNGTVYVPYRFLKIYNYMKADLWYIRKDYKPNTVLKVKMNYSERVNLKLSIGIASDSIAEVPDKLVACHHFIYAGNGKVPMLGRWADGNIHDEPMEFGIDLSELDFGIDTSKPYKLFFNVKTKNFTNGIGKVENLEILKYSDDEIINTYQFEYIDSTINGSGTKLYSIIMPASNKTSEFVYVPKHEISVHSFDSQEIDGEDAPATNAIDGSTGSFWHTQWLNAEPDFPHEIVLKLAKTYKISAFSYLPRQSSENGRIKDYEIYLSADTTDWNEPVASGSWTSSSDEKMVNFTPQNANYVKLKALSEVNGNPWASVAEIDLFYEIESTSLENNNILASDFKLHQNYPNPFNPSTIISFSIPERCDVKLEIYNLLGQRISILANKNYNIGMHQVVWNALDVSSGIYFYKITTINFSETKKMLLQK